MAVRIIVGLITPAGHHSGPGRRPDRRGHPDPPAGHSRPGVRGVGGGCRGRDRLPGRHPCRRGCSQHERAGPGDSRDGWRPPGRHPRSGGHRPVRRRRNRSGDEGDQPLEGLNRSTGTPRYFSSKRFSRRGVCSKGGARFPIPLAVSPSRSRVPRVPFRFLCRPCMPPAQGAFARTPKVTPIPAVPRPPDAIAALLVALPPPVFRRISAPDSLRTPHQRLTSRRSRTPVVFRALAGTALSLKFAGRFRPRPVAKPPASPL